MKLPKLTENHPIVPEHIFESIGILIDRKSDRAPGDWHSQDVNRCACLPSQNICLHVNRVQSWWRSPPNTYRLTNAGVLVTLAVLVLMVTAPELYEFMIGH